MTTYQGIHDTPMIRFKEALAGNVDAMRRTKYFATEKGAYKAFVRVFDEADKAFGIADNYRAYLKARIRAARLWAKGADGQKWNYGLAQVAEHEAEMLLGAGGTGEAFEFTCAQLAKNMGFRVDPKAVTVAEFYSYMKIQA